MSVYLKHVRKKNKQQGKRKEYEYIEKKKILVWHSHYFLSLCITIEEYFIISNTLTFNIYFLCFVVDELSAFIFTVYNFLP